MSSGLTSHACLDKPFTKEDTFMVKSVHGYLFSPDYLLQILNDDASEMSTANENVETWKDWFRRGSDNPESSFLRRIQASDEVEAETPSRPQTAEVPESLSDWPPSVKRPTMPKLSPTFAAVRQKVEKMIRPLFDDTAEPGSGRAL
jgi:hypothetical protein